MSTPLPGFENTLGPLPAMRGLTTAEAHQRMDAGQSNFDGSRQKSDSEIVRKNAFSFYNLVLFGLVAALIGVAQYRDALFVWIVTAANVAVSTFQEIRATHTLRQLKALTAPHALVVRDGIEAPILSELIVLGDLIHLRPGDQVVADGHVLSRNAEVDESLLTGESDSIPKKSGDELRSGSFCTAGDCYYVAEQVGTNSYAVRLTSDARSAVKRTTPLQARFRRILRVLLTATAVLAGLLMIQYNVQDGTGRGFTESIKATTATVTTVVPTGLLLGMTVAFAVGAVRVSRSGAIVQDINAVEALNYVDVICLDKTGTITANKLKMDRVKWLSRAHSDLPWLAAFVAASAGDSKTAGALAEALSRESNGARADGNIPFNSERRWSALRLALGEQRRTFILGAPETVLPLGFSAPELQAAYAEAASRGLRGVVFAEASELPPSADVLPHGVRPLALVTLSDALRPEVKKAFDMMARLGIEPKIISGDNPGTVSALLAQLGIELKGGMISGAELASIHPDALAATIEAHSVFGRVAPAQKAQIIASLREQGHFVAMVGDGANDVQALRAADVAVAMASGTSTARAVAGIVLLNDSFEALIRGTKEATAVLGNAARLSKLFIAKSLYAFLLIVATNMLGLGFPFLPRHGSLTALLTLGIPAVFISISIPPPDAGRDFTRNVLRFALPASLAVAASAISVHLLVDGLMGRDIAEARTLVSLTLGVTGLFLVLEVLGFEGASFRSLTRPVMTTVLCGLLVGALVFTVYMPSLRGFFDFQEVRWWGWTIVIVASALTLVAQYCFTRYWQPIVDVLTAKPKKNDELRGRAV